jgi:hypothetical protein
VSEALGLDKLLDLVPLQTIARRATSVYTVETMPWHQIRRPHVLRIRQLLEDNYQPATANRMLAALRGVLRERWHGGLISTEDYQAARSVFRPSAASQSPAAVASRPASCEASSRRAPELPRNPTSSRTPAPGAGAMPPFWPQPTAAACAGPRPLPSTSPTLTSRPVRGSERGRSSPRRSGGMERKTGFEPATSSLPSISSPLTASQLGV